MWIITITKKCKQSPRMRKRDCNPPLIILSVLANEIIVNDDEDYFDDGEDGDHPPASEFYN